MTLDSFVGLAPPFSTHELEPTHSPAPPARSRMSTRGRLMPAILVALVVLVAGIAYAIQRAPEYVSSGSLVLAPLPEEDSDLTNLLQGFDRSGTMGTFVELIASDDTLRRAGDPPVQVTVRAIPDTRVIEVTTTGDRDVVRPALSALLASAQAARGTLSELWTLRTLESASEPEPAPPSTMLVLLATCVLALLGGVIVFVGFGALGARAQRERLLAAQQQASAEPYGVEDAQRPRAVQ
jgi:hypothetical protein